MKYGRAMTLDLVEGDDPWTTAEVASLEGCDTGEMVRLEGADQPEKATDDNRIRAELIRHLMLGGCKKACPHNRGVQVRRAYVTGVLDLEDCKTTLTLGVIGSTFDRAVNLKDAEIGQVWLDASRLPGLEGQRMRVDRNVMLRHGFHAKGLVNLNGAKIGGQLACEDGLFECGADINGNALPALMGDGMKVTGDVVLSGEFRASGLVNLNGAVIGGQLACTGGRFEGGVDKRGNVLPSFMGHRMKVKESMFLSGGFHSSGVVDLNGSEVNGQLACAGGRFEGGVDKGGNVLPSLKGHQLKVAGSMFLSDGFHASGLVDLNGSEIDGQLAYEGGRFENGGLDLEAVTITRNFFWRGILGEVALLDLTKTQVATIIDDVESWERVERYRLREFQYKSVSEGMTVDDRINWLDGVEYAKIPLPLSGYERGSFPPDTNPQPYTHLARYFDGIGKRVDAAKVRIAREERLARSRHYAARLLRKQREISVVKIYFAEMRYWASVAFGLVFCYGHMPTRALKWSVGIVLFAAWFFGITYATGQMAPNSDVILTSTDWLASLNRDCVAFLDRCITPLRWWETSDSYQDYETFSALGYGFDLFIPLDALGQEKAWAPSYDRGPWGAIGYWLRWAIQVAGWLITFVSAAMLTGLVGKRD